jgi:hypothetical protein
LFQLFLPPGFKPADPDTVLFRFGYIHDDSDEVVPEVNATVAPVTFDLLSLLTGRPEPVNHFEHGLGEPVRRNVPAVVKLERD